MKSRSKTLYLVQLALLTAILLLMAYTPLGYLRVGTIEITFLMLPVAIGAIIIGPSAGAILGGIFGVTSFIQCFGTSPFGVALFAINPVFTFIICMVPRILAGWIPGLIFRAMNRKKSNIWAYAAASFAAPILNTVLFVGTLLVLFGQTDFIRSFGDTTWAIIVLLVGVNGLIEAPVCGILSTAISKAVSSITSKRESA